jgi:4-hydroxybenzoate polyprenyltransferase
MAAASRYLRTLLILGRVSNVPTVWSNCLAGWLLSGGDDWGRFLLLTFGATCLYLGGMFLNDAFDATFDLQHRPERPIPSGAIRVETVWAWGFGWLGLGVACMFGLWQTTLICALLLAVTILVYDAIHKIFALSPVLMAACRFLLVLMAASAGRHGITGLSIWTALALASYIIGLSFLARKESVAAPVSRWPCLFLAVPLMLALVVNQGEYLLRAIVLCVAAGLWMLRCLSFALWSPQRNIGRCVSGLLAGIVLVDLLAAWDGTPRTGAAFVGLFILALLLQRFAPAT